MTSVVSVATEKVMLLFTEADIVILPFGSLAIVLIDVELSLLIGVIPKSDQSDLLKGIESDSFAELGGLEGILEGLPADFLWLAWNA